MPVNYADIQHDYNYFNQQAYFYANIEILRVKLTHLISCIPKYVSWILT